MTFKLSRNKSTHFEESVVLSWMNLFEQNMNCRRFPQGLIISPVKISPEENMMVYISKH